LLAGTADTQILPALARLLTAEEGDNPRFVTVCDVTIRAGGMTVRVAGHPAPIVCGGGPPRYLELRVGAPIGVRVPPEHHADWPDNHVPLAPGASVLLYTDGLLDAFATDTASDSLGVRELVDAVHSCTRNGEPAPAWIPDLLGRAPRESIDDTAVVVLTTNHV
jgi:serine phosphatase RsbU (regulator of sigma subunit)